jgi:hypothetical protein
VFPLASGGGAAVAYTRLLAAQQCLSELTVVDRRLAPDQHQQQQNKKKKRKTAVTAVAALSGSAVCDASIARVSYRYCDGCYTHFRCDGTAWSVIARLLLFGMAC